MILVYALVLYWKYWLAGLLIGLLVLFKGGRQFYTMLGMLITFVFALVLFVPLIIVGIVKLLHL